MKLRTLAITGACVMGFSSLAFALTTEETQVMQKAFNSFYSNLPEADYNVFATDVLKRIKSGKKDFVIVDVRMPKEKFFDKGHLPGAMYIGYRDIAKQENLAKLPKDKDIILYCNTGHEQNKAIVALRMLGYKAFDMKWGYSSWKTGAPTEATLKALEGAKLNNYPVEK